MDSFVQYLCSEPKQLPATSFPVRERLVCKDKDKLDRMVQVKQSHGWILILRTYSMEDGHGAVVVRKALGQAA